MSKTIYDRPEISGHAFASAEAAAAWLREGSRRMNHVLDWLSAHGVPWPEVETRVVAGPGFPTVFLLGLVFRVEGQESRRALPLVLRSPGVTLADMAQLYGGVTYEPWREPVPPKALPTGRPFDFDRPDVFNPDGEAYLNNRNDHYPYGHTWTEGGRVYLRERRTRSFFSLIPYPRWRVIADVDELL